MPFVLTREDARRLIQGMAEKLATCAVFQTRSFAADSQFELRKELQAKRVQRTIAPPATVVVTGAFTTGP